MPKQRDGNRSERNSKTAALKRVGIIYEDFLGDFLGVLGNEIQGAEGKYSYRGVDHAFMEGEMEKQKKETVVESIWNGKDWSMLNANLPKMHMER